MNNLSFMKSSETDKVVVVPNTNNPPPIRTSLEVSNPTTKYGVVTIFFTTARKHLSFKEN